MPACKAELCISLVAFPHQQSKLSDCSSSFCWITTLLLRLGARLDRQRLFTPPHTPGRCCLASSKLVVSGGQAAWLVLALVLQCVLRALPRWACSKVTLNNPQELQVKSLWDNGKWYFWPAESGKGDGEGGALDFLVFSEDDALARLNNLWQIEKTQWADWKVLQRPF